MREGQSSQLLISLLKVLTAFSGAEWFLLILVLAESRKVYAYSLPDLRMVRSVSFRIYSCLALLKRQMVYLRVRCTDNFSSFKSNIAHLASRGCHWEFITPGSSHQNPAERYIQTVNNMLRAVMLASGLPRFLWPIVLSACVFCCNLYPRKGELHSKECFLGVSQMFHHFV